MPKKAPKQAMIRIPVDLLAKVKRVAAREQRSATWMMARLIERGLDAPRIVR